MAFENSKTRSERLVVVGGCAAGMSAASKAKRLNPNLEILALERSPHVSYAACGIPYFISDVVKTAQDLVTITPEEFRSKRKIDVRTQHEVTDIRPAKREVTAVNLITRQDYTWQYDKLIIAVGGKPLRPGIPGADAANVFTIQTLQDGIQIREFVETKKPKRALIVGGGYIGMEMAEAFRVCGLQVTVVEREQHVLPNFEPEIVEGIASELEKNQVVIRTGVSVDRFSFGANGEVNTVYLSGSQESLPVDFVLLCTGLAPGTELAKSAVIRCGATGAIAVDRKLLTSQPNIYAAGDCVEVRNLVSGKPDYVPLGTTANKQGRIAGENIGGGTGVFRGVVGTSVFKVFDLEVATTGLNLKAAIKHGFAADKTFISEKSKAGYYPGGEQMTVAVIFDKRSGKLLGAQMVGKEGVSKRIDVFASALVNQMTLEEMTHLDLSYAPPFAPVWDPVLIAVNAARSSLRR